MKVVITEPALADLAEIARWIGRDSPRQAKSFISRLRARCRELGDRPSLYQFAEGLEEQKIRRRLYRDYLILYQSLDSKVEVLRVLHAARDWQNILRGK